MSTVYAILGPTASGKTNCAMQLVEKHDFEIISVDSAMIYRGMDIGSAKPSTEELAKAPHRLIDFLDPAENYSAADFCRDATVACDEILAAGKKPLLVGGTMMYFQALKAGLADLPSRDEAVRAELENQDLAQLHERLQSVDSAAADKIKPGDSQRIIRALEVYELTGEPISQLQKNLTGALPYDLKAVALMPEDRAWLHERIQRRFELMLRQGFLAEVAALKSRGDLNLEMPSMRCVGYRQAWQYFDGEFDESTLFEKGVAATRQLAKRQLTWLRGFDWVNKIDPTDDDFYAQVETYFLNEN